MKKILSCLLALLGMNAFSSCNGTSYKEASVPQFADLAGQPGVQLVDVRTTEEFAEGHLEGASNIDVRDSAFIQQATLQLDTARPVLVYCRSGRRSADAAKLLTAKGFDVTNLSGGILAWQQAQMPLTTLAAERDVFKTKSGKLIRFHALMHGSIRIEYDGKEIEVDPVRKLGERTVDFAALPKADYIFVTHEHGDHLDAEAIRLLTGETTRLITNQRCADKLGKGEVMANGDRLKLSDDLYVKAVPAYNYTEGRTQFHPQGRDNGFVLTIDGLRIYVAGDTEDVPEMKDIRDIDIAFMPCNQPYTMTPEQLVRAARIVRPRVLFPYHYGQTDVTVIPTLLKNDDIDVRIRHYE